MFQIYLNFAQLYLLTAVPVFALPQITQPTHSVMAVRQVFIQLLELAIPPSVCLSVCHLGVCVRLSVFYENPYSPAAVVTSTSQIDKEEV